MCSAQHTVSELGRNSRGHKVPACLEHPFRWGHRQLANKQIHVGTECLLVIGSTVRAGGERMLPYRGPVPGRARDSRTRERGYAEGSGENVPANK